MYTTRIRPFCPIGTDVTIDNGSKIDSGSRRGSTLLVAITLVTAACQIGCSTIAYPMDVESFSAPPSHPRDPNTIEVLTELPTRPYVQVARLSTESVNYDSTGHAIERLRTAAAERGADAIVVEARGTNAVAPRLAFETTDADFGFGPAVQGPPGESEYMPSQFARVLAIRWTEAESQASRPESNPSAKKT